MKLSFFQAGLRRTIAGLSIFVAWPAGIGFAASPANRPVTPSGGGASVDVHAAGQGNPWINLRDGIDLSAGEAMIAGTTGEPAGKFSIPLSLAAGDFDEDGVSDLAAGYGGSSSQTGGGIFLRRGNEDSIFPYGPGAQARRTSGTNIDWPFYPPDHAFELPLAPDFLVPGDFNADGHLDLGAAARGGRMLVFLFGDGKGNFSPAAAYPLPGAVTALIGGDLNRRDGLEDLAVGIAVPGGGQVLILESPEGAWRAEPEIFTTTSPPVAFAAERLSGGIWMDLAVAAGKELILITGRDRKLAIEKSLRHDVPAARVATHAFPFALVALTAGHFSGIPDDPMELAVLDGSGTLHFLDPTSVPGQPGSNGSTRQVVALSGQPETLTVAKLSSLPGDDLILLDRRNRQLQIVNGGESAGVSPRALPVSLAVDGEPVALLPMRLNEDALSDLVLLHGGMGQAPAGLSVILTAPLATLTVNNTGDGADITPGNGICETGTGTGICTLRAAIQEANALGGANTINFGIGTGARTIAPASALPFINVPVTLNAQTQPGYAGNPIIELNGSGVPAGNNALEINANSCTVRGLVINRFAASGGLGGAGIRFLGTSAFGIIENNYIGTNLGGTGALGNGGGGILLVNTGSFGKIGGSTASARNVISGNTGPGISIGVNSSNTVSGNYIGTDATGMVSLGNTGIGITANSNNTIGGPGVGNLISGNGSHGVEVQGDGNLIQGNMIGTNAAGTSALANGGNGVRVTIDHNTVGGSTASARNVISGNTLSGVAITNVSLNNNIVQGNFIGTQADGVTALPNLSHGISFTSGATPNTVGGMGSAANTIAFNGGAGIFDPDGTGNLYEPNQIFSNGGLGIDVGPAGVTPNGSGYQNFPVLTSANGCSTGTTIAGSLSTPSTTLTVHFFSSAVCDPSRYGEGEGWIGTAVVTTSPNPTTSFTVELPAPVAAGRFITATATQPNGSTSEFSNCVVVTGNQLAIFSGGVSGGNGNGAIDPNECNDASLTLVNQGATTANAVSAYLSAATAGVIVTQPASAYPDIAATLTGANITPFKISTSPLVLCGTPIDLSLKVTTSGGTCMLPLPVSTGLADRDRFFASSGAVAIPDNNPAGVDSPAAVSGVNGTITQATASLYITHTFDSDLSLSLIGADGTTIALSTGNGGSGDNFGTDCPAGSNDTVFDDSALLPVTAGSAPFAGSYKPEQPLAAFKGKFGAAINGSWRLHVADTVTVDTGTLQCWQLALSTASCTDGGGECVPGAVLNLLWTPGSEISLQWDAAVNATGYNLYEGIPANLPFLLTSAADSCRRATTTALTTGSVLAQPPPSGSFLWYLVRAANPSGQGPAGDATSGPEIQDSSGTCP